jgi:hypothetical protein
MFERLERLLQSDAELALEVAKYNWFEFHKIGDAFLSYHDFMLQALMRDGRVLQFSAPTLRQDFEILVIVQNTSKDTTDFDAVIHP